MSFKLSISEFLCNVKVNLNDYFQNFSFVPFLHPDRRPNFQRKIKKYIRNVSDITAAVVTRLFTHRTNRELISEAMNCCQSILHSKGYKALYDNELHKMAFAAEDSSELVIAVLGCQTRQLLYSRVDAAIGLINLLRTNVKLFFSGSAPGSSARIPNESVAMYNYYQRASQKVIPHIKPDLISACPVFLEGASQTTKENIRNLLNKLKKSISKDTFYLFIVSSNFHLAHVDWEFSRFARHPMYKKIDKFFLCGSEDLYRSGRVLKDGRYIKQLFYGIFNNLMQDKGFYNFPS